MGYKGRIDRQPAPYRHPLSHESPISRNFLQQIIESQVYVGTRFGRNLDKFKVSFLRVVIAFFIRNLPLLDQVVFVGNHYFLYILWAVPKNIFPHTSTPPGPKNLFP